MNRMLALGLVLWMSFAGAPTAGAEPIDEHKAIGWFAIYSADALVARPLLMASALAGTGIWLVSLPFTALASDASAFDVLVAKPARAAFARCLGCSLQD